MASRRQPHVRCLVQLPQALPFHPALCATCLSPQSRSAEEFKKVLTAADAPAAMKLLLHDAGTFDKASGTGGCDGSIVLFP